MKNNQLEQFYKESCELILTDGVYNYYVMPISVELGPESTVIRFATEGEAVKFIEASMFLTGEYHLLRKYLKKKGAIRWRLSNKQLYQRAAKDLVNRDIAWMERPSAGGASVGAGEVNKTADIKDGYSFPGGGNARVDFNIIDDATGDPVPGGFLKITLPDGRYKELVSDLNGNITVNDIKPGTCGFDLDISRISRATLENTFAYAGVNHNDPQEPSPNEAKRVHIRRKPQHRHDHRFIADIVSHKAAQGETFSSIAANYNSTFRDLAFFNWGFYDREKVLTRMEQDTGCSTRTQDGKDLAFSGDETPGIVYVPVPLTMDDLPTNATHTLRVKRTGYGLRYLYQIDLDNPDSQNDTITLKSDDNTWEYSLCIKDLSVIEKDFVELIFPCPPQNKTFSMIHNPLDGEDPFYIFKGYTHSELYFGDPEVLEDEDPDEESYEEDV